MSPAKNKKPRDLRGFGGPRQHAPVPEANETLLALGIGLGDVEKVSAANKPQRSLALRPHFATSRPRGPPAKETGVPNRPATACCSCLDARRLKTLNGLTPYEYIARIWTSEPDRFIVNPIHQMPGLNT